ncbi:MAG: hypothetical protein JWL66_1497 [Sphingomonadales bacterium]|nr:hypothetical protein [Sphingomonadales bacterium]
MHNQVFREFYSDIEAEAADQGLVLECASRMVAMATEISIGSGLVNRIKGASQNGLTITRKTMTTTAMPGISFSKRNALPLTRRSPVASRLA